MLNLVLYNIGWFGIVLGVAQGHPGIGSLIAVIALLLHLFSVKFRRSELLLIAAAICVGALIESINNAFVVFKVSSGPVIGYFAPWLLLLWAGFAATFQHSLSWLARRYVLASLLGACGGPLGFWAGEKLGAIDLSDDPAKLLLLAFEWALALPFLIWFSDRVAHGPQNESS